MSYLDEYRSHWRSLLAAALGLASGFTITTYINNLFVPPIMAEFGWSSSDIALVGMTAFLSAICQPLAGRLVDWAGVRFVVISGVILEVLVFLGLSAMGGDFLVYFLLNVAMITLVASTTTAVVYSRLVVTGFARARGIALSMATGAPPLVGALIVPMLSAFIDHDGWRAGYRLVAACVAAGGVLTILMIPRQQTGARPADQFESAKPSSLRALFGDRAFRLIICGMLLCSLSIVMQSTQLKVILLNSGLSSPNASWLISIYAIGVVFGLMLCGAALDWFPAYLVAAISLGLPGVGLAILASGTTSPALLTAAILLLGLSMGAEGNIANYIVAEYFSFEIFSTVVGVMIGAIAFSGAFGSILLSASLKLTGSFGPFLLLTAGCSFGGAWQFWRLKNVRQIADGDFAAAWPAQE